MHHAPLTTREMGHAQIHTWAYERERPQIELAAAASARGVATSIFATTDELAPVVATTPDAANGPSPTASAGEAAQTHTAAPAPTRPRDTAASALLDRFG